MKEYGIYIRCNGGSPYMIHFFNNILSAKQKLLEMIELEEERNRVYFVDNDFFNNKYSLNTNGKYFCIKERDVSDWENYLENNHNINNEKVINFFNYYKN